MPDDVFSDGDIAAASPQGEAPSDGGSPTPDPSTPDTPPADATGQPGAEARAPSADGPIPLDRHKQILEHTRQAYENALGWARGLDRTRTEQSARLYDFIDNQPVEFARWFVQQLSQDPRYAPALQGHEGPPEPDIRLDDGRAFYSAEQAHKLLEWNNQQLRATLDAEVRPIKEDWAFQRTLSKAERDADAAIAEAETWPYFNEYRQAIHQAMEADKRLSLHGAYIRTVPKDIQQRTRAAVLTELKQKPHATTVVPGSPGHTRPRSYRDMDFEELLEHFSRQ